MEDNEINWVELLGGLAAIGILVVVFWLASSWGWFDETGCPPGMTAITGIQGGEYTHLCVSPGTPVAP